MKLKTLNKDTYSQVRAVMVRTEFFATRKWIDQKSRAERHGANPHLLVFERRLIAKAQSIGIPMFSHCVMRSRDEQRRLFSDGRSKAVAGQSPHQHGFAVDIVHSTMAWSIPPKGWEMIGVLGKEIAKSCRVPETDNTPLIEFEWGGDWNFYDPAHWQIKNWRSLLE